MEMGGNFFKNCFAYKFRGNSYRNKILAQDFHLINQSLITKFEVKTTCESRIICCKLLLIFVSKAQKMVSGYQIS